MNTNKNINTYGEFIKEFFYFEHASEFNLVINIDSNTRFEGSGKPYVIFKSFYLLSKYMKDKGILINSSDWIFCLYQSSDNGNIIVQKEIFTSPTLQGCFNHAQKLELKFL